MVLVYKLLLIRLVSYVSYSDGNSLAIVRLGLTHLGLTSLKKINNGHALILLNHDLCYIKDLNLTRIFAHTTQRKKAYKNAEMCG